MGPRREAAGMRDEGPVFSQSGTPTHVILSEAKDLMFALLPTNLIVMIRRRAAKFTPRWSGPNPALSAALKVGAGFSPHIKAGAKRLPRCRRRVGLLAREGVRLLNPALNEPGAG